MLNEPNIFQKIKGVKGAERKTHTRLMVGVCAMNVQKRTENMLKNIMKNMVME